mgnify:CR=1 FL=1
MSEAEKPISAYRTIEDVFTRKLKGGCRTIEGTLVSPADGTIANSLPVKEMQAFQAKGIEYQFEEFVYGKNKSVASERMIKPSWYHTVYLAPHNYHRVHSPVSGLLQKIRYIPGKLWPVNQPFVKRVPNLFVSNERLVFEILVNNKKVFVVMVGALNVGRIETNFWPDFSTNNRDRIKGNTSSKERALQAGKIIAAGDELGVFMLGSTVVTFFEEGLYEASHFLEVADPRPISMGQSLLR